MRYLTVAADYMGSAIKDDYIGSLVAEEAGLSATLGERLRSWNTQYRSVIPLSMEERAYGETRSLIEALDQEGLLIVQAIVAELGDVKVRYYSEGLLRYLERASVEDTEACSGSAGPSPMSPESGPSEGSLSDG